MISKKMKREKEILENFMSIVADEKLDGRGKKDFFILMTQQKPNCKHPI